MAQLVLAAMVIGMLAPVVVDCIAATLKEIERVRKDKAFDIEDSPPVRLSPLATSIIVSGLILAFLIASVLACGYSLYPRLNPPKQVQFTGSTPEVHREWNCEKLDGKWECQKVWILFRTRPGYFIKFDKNYRQKLPIKPNWVVTEYSKKQVGPEYSPATGKKWLFQIRGGPSSEPRAS